jgi:nucleotide-binding universal stress UspA family protein
MRNILVPIEDDRLAQPVLGVAVLAARAFGSTVEGLDARAHNAVLLAADPAAVAALPRASLQEEHRVRRVRATFERIMTGAGFSAVSTAAQGVSYNWRDGAPLEDAEIASQARLYDLVLLARPDADSTVPRISLLEAVLFESGRPLMLVPSREAATLGENIMIAWNRSGETARTVALAMPFLTRAKTVTVLTITGWKFPGPEADELATKLRAAGVAAEAVSLPGEWGDAGRIISDETARRGCDLILKGAYTQSRLRQMIFGGATRHLMWNSTVPVFMAH